MDFSSAPLSSQPKPALPVGRSNKIIGILVAIVVILVIVALILVLAQKNASPKPTAPGTAMTAEQKAKILESLKQEADKTPALTGAEKAKILDSLKQEAAKTPPLTEAERAKILETLRNQ